MGYIIAFLLGIVAKIAFDKREPLISFFKEKFSKGKQNCG